MSATSVSFVVLCHLTTFLSSLHAATVPLLHSNSFKPYVVHLSQSSAMVSSLSKKTSGYSKMALIEKLYTLHYIIRI